MAGTGRDEEQGGERRHEADTFEQEAEKQFRRTEAIINSMTPRERRNPDVLNGSRKRRVATGSGTTVYEVNQLVKQFKDMQKMMKQLGSRKGIPGLPRMR